MLAQNQIAFKEWGAVCAAIGQGIQSVILRKGGIHEGQQGFRVDHREFWLFPTHFHQDSELLQSEFSDLLKAPIAIEPASGKVMLALYAVVDKVLELNDASMLPHLDSIQVLNQDTIRKRYDYKNPGLFILHIRAYQLAQPFEMDNEAHYAGCHSWVELTQELPTDRLTPILSDEQYLQQQQKFDQLIV